ncbi:MAG: hypothetical protein ACXVB1_00265 [Pseudobdellovibrionaceae bacterium]
MTTISSSKVFRSRVDPFNSDALPCVSIEPVSDQADSTNLAYIDWKLLVRITTYAKGDIPDQVADPIIADIHSKMMSDETLGGLLMGMRPDGVNYEFLEAGTPLVSISYDFELSYRTSN